MLVVVVIALTAEPFNNLSVGSTETLLPVLMFCRFLIVL